MHPLKALVMAVRNLVRGGRRTVSTLLAMVVGLIGLTLLDGYITYSMNGLRESVIHSGTGHLQVMSSPKFLDEGDTDPFPFMLDRIPQVEAALRATPGVQAVVPSLSFTAVAGAKGKTTTVLVTALPVAAAKAELRARSIAQGRDLDTADLRRVAQDLVPLFRTYEEQVKAVREWARGRARTAGREDAVVDLFRLAGA